MLQYNIRGENLEVTDSIKEYVEKKVSKLERYFDTPPSSEVHVNLSVYNDEQTIEVTIPMKNLLLRAEEHHTDLYAAIDLVVDKLERQIRKHKTKVNRKFRQEGAPKYVFAELEREAQQQQTQTIDDEFDVEIVKTKRFDLKPMDSEEAALQMDMLGHNFFVFTNANTDETNIVYKRRDGRYGLIET
ncbi:SSU ribosomal protein S30P /sigma 54 modulation protein [Halobacillus karajensis]|uniref:Ribosome hibernation promoting factor n=1 Tax=Halobacillus karajensis TaxID=195088 RepID=A0A059NWH9_9BACI|nr:ribosome-associated translation inhibitor RaiA [Halobacillus karajensis]CDQ19218.1 SigL modulation protein [Halobacillus karajensis]CDQ22708.1 SigL modulation protein [Halobacillus karajensis]CDQ26190.1 SigL modulation protein [Halobacillus karajensis]SEH39889.1 SSU ribosomal protein S30P /sigma 54 modulation protein [Halobacillus karajensis]